jgi:hypothetical protein
VPNRIPGQNDIVQQQKKNNSQRSRDDIMAWLIRACVGDAQITHNLMFVSQMSFFARVSDSRMGGTSMPLLNGHQHRSPVAEQLGALRLRT